MSLELTDTQVRKVEERLMKMETGTRDKKALNHIRVIRLEIRKAKRRKSRRTGEKE